ncbi:MAG TPA: iron ABC transporter permease [Gemmatimonadaceae bacterium]|nr:iron ABC transporter permease [Gemmatimonadaceae bacterium]
MLKALSFGRVQWLLAIGLSGALLLSAAVGAFSFTPAAMVRHIAHALGWGALSTSDTLARNVFQQLRLPRVLLTALTGAVLGVSGTVMQGIFRNPIVEPGLVGTSAGAAFGASLVFVYGGALAAPTVIGSLVVPVMAFIGALAATALVYRLATRFEKVDVITLLLAGIAVNAVCAAGTGFLSFVARDPQARNITFWSLGTFTTATWRGVLLVGTVFIPCYALTLRDAKALNVLMLGEDEAAYLGVDPRRLVRRLLVLNTLMVAVATAMTGVIAFLGLVVPHMLRRMRSSDYRFLLPASALFGAALMSVIDVVARVIIRPAELPIGVITAIVGAPVFLAILLRQERDGVARHG